MLPTSRTTGHLYTKGSPEPQLLLIGRSLAKGLRTQPVPYKWRFGGAWFCQKMRAQMMEIPWERQEGSVPSQHPSNIPAVLGAFLPPSVSPCPEQQRGGPHLHAVLVRKDQMFPPREATTCCRPSCSLWLQRERAVLRSTGAQAMVLLPTTTACAASRRCRRCRARFGQIWAEPSSQMHQQAHLNSSLPKGFRSQTR